LAKIDASGSRPAVFSEQAATVLMWNEDDFTLFLRNRCKAEPPGKPAKKKGTRS
jgi:hypothetical protein